MPATGGPESPPCYIKKRKCRVKNKEKYIKYTVPHDGIEDKKEKL